MIIRNVSLLSFSTLSCMQDVDVRIRGNRIAKIGRNLKAESEQIDGRGCYLIPGLVNTHAHTAMTLLRGAAEDIPHQDWFNKHIWVYEQNLEPEDVYAGTLLGAAEMLLAGVTTVGDHYFHMDQAYRAYHDIGMRADLAWAVFGVGEDWQQRFDQASQFAADHQGRETRLCVSLGPHSPYVCPPEFLELNVRRAEELGLKLHIHVAETQQQVARSLSATGLTPVEVLGRVGILRRGTILAHAYYANDEDMRLIAKRGCGVAHCAKTYLKLFADLHDFLSRARKAGVTVGLGSDGACSNNSLSILEVARDTALLAKCAANSPENGRIEDVLPLLCRGGAVLGLKNYGELEEGSLADCVLISARSPNMVPAANIFANLLYAVNERNVDTVIVDGRVVVRRGRLVSLDTDLEGLYETVEKISRRLRRVSKRRPAQKYRE
jgi:5-methylthioadenosine/S-adenosylhomocysteine deaminase